MIYNRTVNNVLKAIAFAMNNMAPDGIHPVSYIFTNPDKNPVQAEKTENDIVLHLTPYQATELYNVLSRIDTLKYENIIDDRIGSILTPRECMEIAEGEMVKEFGDKLRKEGYIRILTSQKGFANTATIIRGELLILKPTED